MYKETRIVQASEIGYHQHIRITDLINIIQDVEGAHIESHRPLSDAARTDKFAILLNFRYVHIKKWPVYKDMIEMTTSTYETKPFYGYRNTMIDDLKGENIVETYCLGSFVNLEKLSPHRLRKEVLETIPDEPKREMKDFGRRVDLNRNLKEVSEATVIVQPLHLDYYMHLNNAFYVEFAANQLPLDYAFNTVLCEYRFPFDVFDSIKLVTYQTDNSYMIKFLNQSDTIHAIIEFMVGS